MIGKNIQKTINVEGMRCGHCASKVEDNIKKIKGVKTVKADFTNGSVTISSKLEIDEEILNACIENLGYKIIN